MNKIFNFKFFLWFFVLFIFILLIEGFYYHYYFKISLIFEFLPHENRSGYNSLIWSEMGIVEFLQVLMLIMSLFFVYKFISVNHIFFSKLLKITLSLYLIGLLYYLFEEISWGQHIFNWQSPSLFKVVNHQNETNLHNISSLFNELPRNLLLIWCSLSFLFVRIFKNNFTILKKLIYPNKNLKLISFLIMFFFIPDFFVGKLGLEKEASNESEILFNYFLNIISFNFIRLSELQELLFNYYIVWHSFYLLRLKLKFNDLT